MSATRSMVGEMVGLCACPSCGWTAGGTLRVRDLYDDAYPPGPRGPFDWREVVTDDEERGVLMECPKCDEPFDDVDGMRFL